MVNHWGTNVGRESGVIFGLIAIYIIHVKTEHPCLSTIISDHACLVLFRVAAFDVATRHHKQRCETLQNRGRQLQSRT